jgi:hydroxymethylpyrimidine/phosphomethylpyrimidine kinase
VRIALTIAGSDPSGGAGIQADLKTFAAHGVYGASAITAATVQSTSGVSDVVVLGGDFVSEQIEAIAGDMRLHAVKIGMLGTAAVVEAVAAAIEELDLPQVVVDPVMVSTSGEQLLDADGVRTLCTELVPRALVVTPNIPEAEVLSGHAIGSREDARRAARTIQHMGCTAVIITGGHSAGDDVIDLLFDGTDFSEFRTPRVADVDLHGTGCTFSAALAANLANGRPLVESAARAQAYVAGALAQRLQPGRGRAVLNHLWKNPYTG